MEYLNSCAKVSSAGGDDTEVEVYGVNMDELKSRIKGIAKLHSNF
jgi:hypothetical protein